MNAGEKVEMLDRNGNDPFPSPAVLSIFSFCKKNPDRKKINTMRFKFLTLSWHEF